jgi:hypothetical protein
MQGRILAGAAAALVCGGLVTAPGAGAVVAPPATPLQISGLNAARALCQSAAPSDFILSDVDYACSAQSLPLGHRLAARIYCRLLFGGTFVAGPSSWYVCTFPGPIAFPDLP